MDWEGGPYMYGGVNLPRHAKPKREVSKEGMCQRDAGYARNTIREADNVLIVQLVKI